MDLAQDMLAHSKLISHFHRCRSHSQNNPWSHDGASRRTQFHEKHAFEKHVNECAQLQVKKFWLVHGKGKDQGVGLVAQDLRRVA